MPRDIPLVPAPRTPPRQPSAVTRRRRLPFAAAAVGALAVGVLLGALAAWATEASTSPDRTGSEMGDAVPVWVRQEPAGDGVQPPLVPGRDQTPDKTAADDGIFASHGEPSRGLYDAELS